MMINYQICILFCLFKCNGKKLYLENKNKKPTGFFPISNCGGKTPREKNPAGIIVFALLVSNDVK